MAPAPDPLTVEVSHVPGVDVVTVSGELDLYTQARLRIAVVDAHRFTAPVIVIDLNGIGFVDSQGVACLAIAQRLIAGGGAELVLAVDVPRIGRLLHVTGLDQVLRVVTAVDGLGGTDASAMPPA